MKNNPPRGSVGLAHSFTPIHFTAEGRSSHQMTPAFPSNSTCVPSSPVKVHPLARFPLVALCLLIFLPIHFTPLHGYLSQYGQQPTDATIAYRQSVGDIPADLSPYAGVVAVEDCRYIGQPAILHVDHQFLPVIIFDCLGRDITHNWMQANHIIAEVGYYLAQDLNILNTGGVPASLYILEK